MRVPLEAVRANRRIAVMMDTAKASRDFDRKDTREEAARMRDKLTKVYALIAADVGMDLWNETQAELVKIRSKK